MSEVNTPTSHSPQDGVELSAPARPAEATSNPKTAPTVSPHELYRLPAPIRTFPLPTFYPNNPISLLQLAWVWARQALFPPREPSVILEGVWSPELRSVKITDEATIRALWEQGFYGKGSLSRSEPNWLKREKVRRGLLQAHVSEEHTASRRAERIKMKWERARAEQEAIRQTRLEEAREAQLAPGEVQNQKPVSVPVTQSLSAPIGPHELLALPNAVVETEPFETLPDALSAHVESSAVIPASPTGPSELLSLPNSSVPAASIHTLPNGFLAPPASIERLEASSRTPESRGTASDESPPSPVVDESSLNGKVVNGSAPLTPPSDPLSPQGDDQANGSSEHKTLRHRKSVRFSPRVESTTFQLFDPPSPSHALLNGGSGLQSSNGTAALDRELDLLNKQSKLPSPAIASPKEEAAESPQVPEEILDKEHLQLVPEEAFFLAFGLGAMKVLDPTTREPMDTTTLLRTFRQTSKYPSLSPDELQPDDGFLVQYAVYHHFRSLGWVPRPGIKFGMDWMLYVRGPVFDHAEFGIIVIPSYSHPWWKESGRELPRKTWAWLHGLVRVLSQVHKSLMFAYVDIPPPPMFDEAMEKGPAEAFKLYKVREIMVKRWSGNRNR